MPKVLKVPKVLRRQVLELNRPCSHLIRQSPSERVINIKIEGFRAVIR